MELATGALGTLLPKLAQLLHGEYELQRSVRENIKFLQKKVEQIQAALRVVGEVPPEQQDELVKIWAQNARELSYDIEDAVDTFLVRVEGPNPPSRRNSFFTKLVNQKMKSMVAVGKHHHIGEQIKYFKGRVEKLAADEQMKYMEESAARRNRYKVDTINREVITMDPRIRSPYVEETGLVGIERLRNELVMRLTKGDDMSMQKQIIVSIVGFGGSGKTTLAKVVFEKIKSQFDCSAFVVVSRNPDMKNILKDMVYELDRKVFSDIHNISMDERQLIDIIRRFLHDKRYLIVIDDIWNISRWDIIKLALPDYNTACRIITTTRIASVANHIGHYAYEMEPLSIESSRVLLYRKVFGTEDPEKCLDEKLKEVSDRILEKCAGVPLAIITIASLLAGKGRNEKVWVEVCNSIGKGMENNLDLENMRKVLSYSYYDLPSYLKTCLLYLSVFPEDFEIKKDRLIWLWIAEGFIQPIKQWKKSLFELGETYFNELIDRNMIQPVCCNYSKIWGCCVHDMVFDLICSISSEENFVTIPSNMDTTFSSPIVRRLSLQSGKKNRGATEAIRSVASIRSVVVFPSALDKMPAFQSFKVLRILDLQGFDLSQGCNLECLGTLFHLRYLSLKETGIDQLPDAIGNLQYLEILDVGQTKIGQLPKCVTRLTHLLCLSVDWGVRISNGIGNLILLEELKYLSINDESMDNIHDLGLLTELRVLSIMLMTDECISRLVDSLSKLRKIQSLTIRLAFEGHECFGRLDAWVASPQLRFLYARDACWFSTLPSWLKNSTQFQDLEYLSIFVMELQQEDLEILGRLPALHHLDLRVNHEDLGISGRFVIGAGCFPCLEVCLLWGFLRPLIFQQGAMPRLWYLVFDFHLPVGTEITGSNGGFDCELGNLQSLEICSVQFKGGASEVQVEEAKTAVRRAVESHPNQPRLYIA